MKKLTTFTILSLIAVAAYAGTVHIYERTQFNEKIILAPGPNTQYAAMDFLSKDSQELIARIVAHEWSNEKNNEPQYLHEHFTIYVTNNKGGLVHGLDITLNRDKPQVHLHGDTIWKTKGSRPVLQSVNGRFYALEIKEWYETDENNNAVLKSELVHVLYDRDDVHWGNSVSRPVE